ncbi:MarR family winged helix-turn-helix transcriptional regulator [Loktanella sp. Alg231-35]|uniref:MarR family winged helix-turn-helix transcriptional regulator n=1 Tax=Loktanella sp. Alg231-35 TaxID=1922220 RepID=UPI000D553C19|nr:MarR family transcriptional regulator [Loktanella sp. Alg231-35]
MPLPSSADEMYCFAVYTAWHRINRAYAPLLREIGLTYPQYITLTLLWERDAQSVGDLAQRLGMETNTVTPLLKRLQADGHVTRQRGKDDKRKVFVHLTGQGRALQAKAEEITRCIVEQSGFALPKLDALVEQLKTLSNNLTPQD